MHDVFLQIILIVALGIAAQWLGWFCRLPSILLLLLFGILFGPVLKFIQPNQIFHEILHPLVSISVAVILFEGGLSLRFGELKKVAVTVRNLLSVGALGTWLLITAGAVWFLDMSLHLALLLGAILVVTGPTVIIPILRHLRLSGKVGPVLKWEGMMIDPIGVILSVLVFEAVLSGELSGALTPALVGFFSRVICGASIGILFGEALVMILRRYWVPNYLENAVTLMFVVVSYGASNYFFSESGLIAVTLMGILLANQRQVSIKQIIEFKENLRVLLIAFVFIILSARLEVENLWPVTPSFLTFFIFLIFVVRPAAVFVSSLGTDLTLREKLFLSFIAPRGVVAAAVASIFSLALEPINPQESQALLTATFSVIIGTISFYSLIAAPVAYLLGVSRPNPQGLLVLGAHDWIQDLAGLLKEIGVKVVLVDTNERNVRQARSKKLPAVSGNILSEDFTERLDLNGIGSFLGMTSNEEVNSLASHYFERILGRSAVYQLPSSPEKSRQKAAHGHMQGRFLFQEAANYEFFETVTAKGGTFEKITFSEGHPYEIFNREFGNRILPLFLWTKTKQLRIANPKEKISMNLGDTLVYLLDHRPTLKTVKTK